MSILHQVIEWHSCRWEAPEIMVHIRLLKFICVLWLPLSIWLGCFIFLIPAAFCLRQSCRAWTEKENKIGIHSQVRTKKEEDRSREEEERDSTWALGIMESLIWREVKLKILACVIYKFQYGFVTKNFSEARMYILHPLFTNGDGK